MEKRLLISDYCCEDEKFEEEIRVKLNMFILGIFGKEVDVEYDISPLYINEPIWTVDSHISIRFPSYTYLNKVHGEQIESIGMQLEDKGL